MTPEQVNEKLELAKEQWAIALGRLENKIDAKFNAIDAKFNAIDGKFNAIDGKFNSQRILLLSIVLGVVAQIVNAWILHVHQP
jgi:hypothetical protein